MQIIEMQLNKFFHDGGGSYRKNNIQIDYHLDNSVIVCCDVPDLTLTDEDLTVELLSEHDTLADFVYEYVITEISDLNKIIPELIFKMFQVGRSELRCYLDPDMENYLSFRRKGDFIIATNPEQETHTVPAHVKTPQELLIYTEHYYEKLFS